MSIPTPAGIVIYAAQILILIAGAQLAASLCRLSSPPVRLAFWRAMILIALALPMVPPLYAYAEPAGGGRSAREVIGVTIQAFGASGARWVSSVIPLVWLAGASIRGAHLLVGAFRLRRLRLTSQSIALHAEVEKLLRRAAVSADVRAHAAIDQPVTFGAGRPLILVPPAFADLPLDVQRGAILHESLHVARRDWLHLLAEEAVRTAFWFHPAMWWSIDRVQLAREQVVDERVVHTLGGRQAYMVALASFAGIAPAIVLATPFMRRRHLTERIRALVPRRPQTPLRTVLVLIGLTLGASAAVAAAASLPPAQQDSTETIFEAGDGVTLPAVESQVRPEYPEAAKAARIEGVVVLECVIPASGGAPQQIKVTESLDTKYGLDEASIDALKQWRFKAGTRDGKPVAVRVHVQMKFTLK